jgi:hypothetical protein
MLPEGKSPPRVSIGKVGDRAKGIRSHATDADGYILTTLTRNDRITSKDWYQDVRHLEFDFDHDIMHVFLSSHCLCVLKDINFKVQSR